MKTCPFSRLLPGAASVAVLLAPLFLAGGGERLAAAETPAVQDAAGSKAVESGAGKFKEKGGPHLEEILRQPWAKGWTGSQLTEVRRVEPKPGAKLSARLPAVWQARIEGPEGKTGYLMWEADPAGEGKLVEFALDDRLEISGPDGKALGGVTGLQQFPLPNIGNPAEAKEKDGTRSDGRAVASGCVPTAGASVFDFWLNRQGPGSSPAATSGQPPDRSRQLQLQDLTMRLRGRINMMTIPDRDGFTDGAMDLAGANPEELAKAIRAEAEAQKLAVDVTFGEFSFDTLKTEINAGRPALLSCVVRVPHKPELSWGHEVAAVGWLELESGGLRFAGILDNFFPAKHPETVRWIRRDAFQSLITVRPVGKD